MSSTVVHDALTSVIGRVVAALTPVLAGLLAAVLFWVQDAVGIDLQVDPAVAAAFIGTIVLGGCLTGLKWLENRGHWERAVLIGKKMHDEGSAGGTTLAPPRTGQQQF